MIKIKEVSSVFRKTTLVEGISPSIIQECYKFGVRKDNSDSIYDQSYFDTEGWSPVFGMFLLCQDQEGVYLYLEEDELEV
jgi:hypothetical protein